VETSQARAIVDSAAEARAAKPPIIAALPPRERQCRSPLVQQLMTHLFEDKTYNKSLSKMKSKSQQTSKKPLITQG
jgi:hypothetical protein